MEPSNIGKSRGWRSKTFQHDPSSKGQHITQSASEIEEVPQQDNNPDDSSSSGVDSYEEGDEIDPDDSISAAAKQPPNQRTKRSIFRHKNATHQHQHQHQQQPQPVPSSISAEPGAAGRHVYPHPYNSFFGPGIQGMAGWVPPPAACYGNAGYMRPNQDHPMTPYWQRPPHEEPEGSEMMPYPMWNPFAPGQGIWPPPAAPVGRKSRRTRKRSPKGKERPQSIHAHGAGPRPDGSAADRTNPGKGSGKSEGDVDTLRLAADVDAVYSSAEAKDLTVHLEFDLFRDLDEELEEFNLLARMGNFAAANSFFEVNLKEHMNSDPSIFVQYAEMLLMKGDFRSVLLLDGNPVFGSRGFSSRKHLAYSEARDPLEMNWMLVRASALIHSQHELHRLRVFSLGIRLTRLAADRTILLNLAERDLSDWADWSSIYRQLLAEQRIWDFRDVLIDACVSYDTDEALNAFLDRENPIEGMVADWQTDTPDESTQLALLDLLSFIALRSDQSPDEGGLVSDCLRLAEPIGTSLLDKFPRTVHSRPFIQWLVCKAVMKNGSENFAYLQDFAGVAVCPKSVGALPFYIPIRQENPGWMPQELTTAARDVLQATLKASRDMNDYQTEALCLKSLALGTKDATAYFQQLGQLQKKQQNMAGFLSTCLTRYLICQDDESKKNLLDDLNSFGSWKDESDLLNPIGAASRDVLQHALSRGPPKSSSPSILSASKYSLHLPDHFKSIFRHLPRPRLTETVGNPCSEIETSPVEPHMHSDSEDGPHQRPEKATRSRTHGNNNRGSRVRKKYEAKDNRSAAPGFYTSPWPNHGMPPYYPMNLMYGAQPPPPTESLARPPPPRPAAEEHRPTPEVEELKRQLELLQAERRAHEESKRQADIERKIKEETERAFKIRMEEMHKAQEEAKNEIELAKRAAERAAWERFEAERKGEAERQRQYAEMMIKVEHDARERLDKERKEEAERQRQHAEAMALAEHHAKERHEAALKAEEVQRWREKEMRENMRQELREELREEMRSQAREDQGRMEGEKAGEEKKRGRRRSTS